MIKMQSIREAQHRARWRRRRETELAAEPPAVTVVAHPPGDRTSGTHPVMLALILAAMIAALMMAVTAPARAASIRLTAWGYNVDGQLGNGTTVRAVVPGPVKGLMSGVSAISAGENDSLALLNNGKVMAWGADFFGQLGTGSTIGPEACALETYCSRTPVPVSSLSQVTAISAGQNHGLALLQDGKVMAWGESEQGQLGNGTTTGPEVCKEGPFENFCSAKPVEVIGLTEVKAISAGANFSLALLRSGKVMAWGSNGNGELGNGTTMSSDVPVEVTGLTAKVTAISAGGGHSLALLEGGNVMAWGSNFRGQLGNGTHTGSDVPVEVKGLTEEVRAVSAGHDNFSTALMKGGTVEAWGNNQVGQLGRGTNAKTEFDSATPAPVRELTGAIAISGGDNHAMALLESHKVMAWGEGVNGELGNGLTEESDVPVAVCALGEKAQCANDLEATAISAGGLHNLASALRPVGHR